MKFIFDLDLTIWDCYDIHGNPIWAKQMVPPYYKQVAVNEVLTDDVRSFCSLRKGVKEFLIHLRKENYEIGFLSAGGILNLPFEYQPSVKLLKQFEILDKFNYIKMLEYKTYDKAFMLNLLNEDVVFFDDSEKVLNSVKDLKHVKSFDSSNIIDWNDMIGIDYDRYFIRTS